MSEVRPFRSKCSLLVVSIIAFFGANTSTGQSIIHVDSSANAPPHNGISWCNAYLDLNSALTAATPGTTIRIAKGIYRPNPTGLLDPRSATFTLKSGVAVEGGYEGCGAPNPNQRDATAWGTVLSGDVADNDPGGNEFRDCCHSSYLPGCPDAACSAAVCAAHSFCCTQWEETCAAEAQTLCASLCQSGADNAYHVVTGNGVDATAILDRVTVTEGKADVPAFGSLDAQGGGLFAVNGSPTILHCNFILNDARDEGGGVYLEGSLSQFIDCRFENNRARNYVEGGAARGGGLFSTGGDVYLADCTFHDNMTDSFGAGAGLIVSGGSATLLRPMVTENKGAPIDSQMNAVLTIKKAYVVGNFTGIRLSGTTDIADSVVVRNYGAGIAIQGGSLTATNCLVAGNLGGGNGGGFSVAAANAAINSCTITTNAANANGGGLYISGTSNVVVTNSVVWNNSANLQGQAVFLRTLSGGFIPTLSVSYANLEGLQGGVGGSGTLNWGQGNFSADPMFVDANGADQVPGNEDDNLRLQQSSPCIDTGFNMGVPGLVSDLDGNPRIVDGNSDGTATIDLGAFETQRPVPAIGSLGAALLTVSILIAGALVIRARAIPFVDSIVRRLSMRTPPPPPRQFQVSFC